MTDHIDITRKEMVRAGLIDCDCEICAAVHHTLRDAERWAAIEWAHRFAQCQPCLKDCPGYGKYCKRECSHIWEQRDYWLEKWRARSDG